MPGLFPLGPWTARLARSAEEAPGRCLSRHLPDENLAVDLRDRVAAVVDLGGAPFASWLLARLTRLLDGATGVGPTVTRDGGCWTLEAIVCDADGSPVAAFYADGWAWFTLLEVHFAAYDAPPETIAAIGAALVHALAAEPLQLSLCRVTVHDPERGHAWTYGWDGTRFLGVATMSPRDPPPREGSGPS